MPFSSQLARCADISSKQSSIKFSSKQSSIKFSSKKSSMNLGVKVRSDDPAGLDSLTKPVDVLLGGVESMKGKASIQN